MAAPPLPDGLNYIAAIKPALQDILISQSFLVILLPLSIALWIFSTERTRRQPVFILNAVSIALAITVGVMLDWRSYQLMVNPTKTYPLSFNLAISILGVIQAILVDTILLLRLISVYPLSLLGTTRFVSLITLPIALKIARFINLVLIIKMLADGAKQPNAEEVLQVEWASAPYVKIEWFAELFDVTYASAFFIYKIWLHRKERRSVGTGSSRSSFTRRLRHIFWIALTNFVIPALFTLVQIIVVYSGADPTTLNDIVLVNTNLAVVGVVFASIWAGSYSRGWRGSSETYTGPGQAYSTSIAMEGRGRGAGSAGMHISAGERSMRFATRGTVLSSTTETPRELSEREFGPKEAGKETGSESGSEYVRVEEGEASRDVSAVDLEKGVAR